MSVLEIVIFFLEIKKNIFNQEKYPKHNGIFFNIITFIFMTDFLIILNIFLSESIEYLKSF